MEAAAAAGACGAAPPPNRKITAVPCRRSTPRMPAPWASSSLTTDVRRAARAAACATRCMLTCFGEPSLGLRATLSPSANSPHSSTPAAAPRPARSVRPHRVHAWGQPRLALPREHPRHRRLKCGALRALLFLRVGRLIMGRWGPHCAGVPNLTLAAPPQIVKQPRSAPPLLSWSTAAGPAPSPRA